MIRFVLAEAVLFPTVETVTGCACALKLTLLSMHCDDDETYRRQGRLPRQLKIN
jgi:hypothetical protein